MPSGKRWSWTITSGVLALVLAGCHYHYETPRPTQFTPVNVDIVAVDSIVKYGRSLVYDSVYGAADSQRVDFATGLIGSGDWAIIQPEKGAWALDEREVALAPGLRQPQDACGRHPPPQDDLHDPPRL